jgi:hypothetical protein
MNASDYPYTSAGTLLFDPGKGTRHFEPWWAMLVCDEGIAAYYAWHLLRHGIDLERGSRWGAHVCFVRGEAPPRPAAWGQASGEVTFHYSNVVHWTNGRHAWVNVWCPALNALRADLGLPVKPHARYHLTLGRLTSERDAAL